MSTNGPRFFSVVILKNSKKILIVDEKWIETQINAHDVNVGAKRSLERTIFYSPVSKDPDFNLPIRNVFDDDYDACYKGFFLKSFGKFID